MLLWIREVQRLRLTLQHQNYTSCKRSSCPTLVVVAFFWARVSRRLVVEDARFRMRINLGAVLIRSLACTKCVPGRLRSGSGVTLI